MAEPITERRVAAERRFLLRVPATERREVFRRVADRPDYWAGSPEHSARAIVGKCRTVHPALSEHALFVDGPALRARIKELEAALRAIANVDENAHDTQWMRMMEIARAALDQPAPAVAVPHGSPLPTSPAGSAGADLSASKP